MGDGYSTIHYSRVQYSTIQYCTVQYNTMLYSTVRYITPGEETTHTITHRPTISLCCPCVLCLLRRLSSSPSPPEQRPGVLVLHFSTFRNKIHLNQNYEIHLNENYEIWKICHIFGNFYIIKKKTIEEKISPSRFLEKKKKKKKKKKKISPSCFLGKKKKKKKKKS